MSIRPLFSRLALAAQPASVAFEIAAGRVTVAEIAVGAQGAVTSAWASEPLGDGAVTPQLTGTNIANPALVTAALRRVCDRAGIRPPKRAALVVPDSVARVSLLSFDALPARAADVDQLVRWQIKKSLPFAIDDAQLATLVTHKTAETTTVAAVAAPRAVVGEYEAAVTALGTHVGIVDLASLNVINALLASPDMPSEDWLLVCLARESTTLAIVRQGALVFHRHRVAVSDEPLSALVHQTAMYHEDRLGGRTFSRVWLCGSTSSGRGGELVRREVSERLGVVAAPVDVGAITALRDRITPGADVMDALAAPLGLLLRERRVA